MNMRKNKGFTLIELLAVIVVLAVIALIATPIVLSLVNSAKEGAAEASAYAYVKEVETYIMLTKLNPDLPKLENGKTYEVSKIKYEEVAFIDLFMDRVYAEENETIYLNDLIDMKGEKPVSGKVTIEENGISEAKFVVKQYNVYCDEEICKANGKSKVEKKELKIELGELVVTYNSITIPFSVNEDADEDLEVKVYYGETESLGNEVVCENNKCEITGLNEKTKYYYKVVGTDTFGNEVNKESNITTLERELLCKRATKLNTEKCENNSSSKYYCLGAGYAKNATITYGRLGEAGKLTSGDAFDCDVNNDGNFTERFYYITDSSDGNAVLIYNNNTKSGVDNINYMVAYSPSNQNYNGPTTAKSHLPKTSQWTNSKIIYPKTRTIVNEKGGNVAGDKTLPTAFSYSGYAARFLTTQELSKACGISQIGEKSYSLKKCVYLLENSGFAHSAGGSGNINGGFWFENPEASNITRAWHTDTYYVNEDYDYVGSGTEAGVRPVIEVAKKHIEI